MRLLTFLFPAAVLIGCCGLLAEEPLMTLTATSANVAGAPDKIRVQILRWSTDAERDELIDAWNLKTPAAEPAAAGRGGGRGAGGGGRGGRGGRGAAAPEAPLTPEQSLEAALEKAPGMGYLWSSEVAGYTIRYAAKFAEPGGGERIVLVTDRRLGDTNDQWKTPQAPPPYDFSVIELHLNAKGAGEGKTSLSGKIAIDSAAKSIGLSDYAAFPVLLKNVAPGK